MRLLCVTKWSSMPEFFSSRTGLTALLLIAVSLMPACATTSDVSKKAQYSVDGSIQSAQRAQNAGKPSEALFFYNRVLQDQPDNRYALMGSGKAAGDLDKPLLAERYFNRVINSNKDDAEALEERGLARINAGKQQQAMADLLHAVRIKPEQWRSWNGLGVLADRQADHANSEKYYRKALDILPDYPPLLNNFGYSLLSTGQYKQAEQVLRKGILYAPNNIGMINNLGLTLAWLGRYDEALKILVKGVDVAQAHNNIGYIAMQKKEYKRAISYFDNALKLNPVYYVRAAENQRKARQALLLQSTVE